MGVSSCTGPSCEEGALVCIAVWGVKVVGSYGQLQYLRG